MTAEQKRRIVEGWQQSGLSGPDSKPYLLVHRPSGQNRIAKNGGCAHLRPAGTFEDQVGGSAPFVYATFSAQATGHSESVGETDQPQVTNLESINRGMVNSEVTHSLPREIDRPSASNQIRLFASDTKAASASASAVLKTRTSEVPYLQLDNGFILFGVDSGLMMVNQQAANERILYEKSLEEMRQPGRLASQQLLFPEVLDLPTTDSRFLEAHLDHLQDLGFDLESVGGNTFQLRGLPMEVNPDQARRVVYEMVEGLLRGERGGSARLGEDFLLRSARVYSRVTSVKLGDPLEYPLDFGAD